MSVRVVFVLAVLAQPACVVGHGSIGARTPVSGELDAGAQTRFSGGWGIGTGYIGPRGGIAGGVRLEHIPPGKNHAAAGGWGLLAIGVLPYLQTFGRVTYTTAVDTSNTKCTPQICGRSFGLAIGAHLIKVKLPKADFDGDTPDAPVIGGAGLALAYHRVNLDGPLGHYIGLELTVTFSGAITTSHTGH